MTDAARSTSRRAVVGGIVGLGVGAPVLAACGGSPSGSASGGSGSGGSGSGSDSGAVAKTSDIPEGGGKIFSDRRVVVTQPTSGQFKAFSAICTHQGCIVSSISDGDIDCGCHGSRFSIKDGSVVNGPATRPLDKLTATVANGEITVS
jgi:Rieske Fe-S protein